MYVYCCIVVARRGWVGWCARVGRSVGLFGECARGFVAMSGSRVLQFCFLDPSCFRSAIVVQGGWVDRFVGYGVFFLFLLPL